MILIEDLDWLVVKDLQTDCYIDWPSVSIPDDNTRDAQIHHVWYIPKELNSMLPELCEKYPSGDFHIMVDVSEKRSSISVYDVGTKKLTFSAGWECDSNLQKLCEDDELFDFKGNDFIIYQSLEQLCPGLTAPDDDIPGFR